MSVGVIIAKKAWSAGFERVVTRSRRMNEAGQRTKRLIWGHWMAIKNVFEETQKLKDGIENLSVDDLATEMAAVTAGDTLLVDLREIQEVVDLGTIPGAKHVPRGMMEFWADPASPYYRDYFQEDKRTIVFCAGGGRSVYAVLALKDMGFKDVAHLEAGFNGWKKADGDVEDVSETSKWVRRT